MPAEQVKEIVTPSRKNTQRYEQLQREATSAAGRRKQAEQMITKLNKLLDSGECKNRTHTTKQLASWRQSWDHFNSVEQKAKRQMQALREKQRYG